MKIIKNKKIHLARVFTGAAIILLLGAGAYFIFIQDEASNVKDSDLSSKIDDQEPTRQQKESGIDTKKEAIDSESKQSSPESKDDTSPRSTQDSSNVSVQINSYRLDDAGNLMVLTTISTLNPDGVCKLTLTKDNQEATVKSPTRQLTSYSTCSSLSIPASEISPGTWTAKLAYEDSLGKGEATLDMEL